MTRTLDFSKQINTADDLRKFALVFQQLKEDYKIEKMETALLVYDIIARIKSGDLSTNILAWEDYDHE